MRVLYIYTLGYDREALAFLDFYTGIVNMAMISLVIQLLHWYGLDNSTIH